MAREQEREGEQTGRCCGAQMFKFTVQLDLIHQRGPHLIVTPPTDYCHHTKSQGMGDIAGFFRNSGTSGTWKNDARYLQSHTQIQALIRSLNSMS